MQTWVICWLLNILMSMTKYSTECILTMSHERPSSLLGLLNMLNLLIQRRFEICSLWREIVVCDSGNMYIYFGSGIRAIHCMSIRIVMTYYLKHSWISQAIISKPVEVDFELNQAQCALGTKHCKFVQYGTTWNEHNDGIRYFVSKNGSFTRPPALQIRKSTPACSALFEWSEPLHPSFRFWRTLYICTSEVF